MAKYTVALRKTIVIEVEARNADEAKDQASLSPEYKGDPDGTWEAAEPEIDVLGKAE